LQIQAPFRQDISGVKRNFYGDITEYKIEDFRKACAENENLDSFNHHLTGGIIGLSSGGESFLIANARQALGSMAYCPMRLRRVNNEDIVYMNPFGTYNGRQRKHPTYGSGLGAKAAVYSAPQYRSLAPAYNGARETMLLALFHRVSDPDIINGLTAFADGAPLLNGIMGGNADYWPCCDDFAQVHKPAEAAPGNKKSVTRSIPIGLQARIAFNSVLSKWKF
jgi:hypothetical protein